MVEREGESGNGVGGESKYVRIPLHFSLSKYII